LGCEDLAARCGVADPGRELDRCAVVQQRWADHADTDPERVQVGRGVLARDRLEVGSIDGSGAPAAEMLRPGRSHETAGGQRTEVATPSLEVEASGTERSDPSRECPVPEGRTTVLFMTFSPRARALGLDVPDRPLHHLLEDAAAAHPDRVVLHFDDRAVSNGELMATARGYAGTLLARGLDIGDRVALCSENRPEWLAAQQGISMAGGAAVLVNSSWRAVELAHAFDLTRPAAVVADAAMAERLVDTGLELPPVRLCLDEQGPAGWEYARSAEGGQLQLPRLDVDLARLEAVLPFSSGTTGLPKAVRHSHRGLVAGALARSIDYGVTSQDRLQYFMPLFTIYGVAAFLSVLGSGASLRLFRRFDAPSVLSNIEEEAITVAFGGAPIAAALREQPLERYDLSSLRYMMWAATPVIPELANEITRRAGIRWLVAYGTTECAIACNLVDAPATWRLDSPGPPMTGVEIRVVDIDSGRDVSAGEQGEILARSPTMMLGYLPEEDTADAIADGWLRTGDIGWVEPGDWIHITDRSKEMIKVSAFNVAPAEIERVLFEHPAVADCAVYGIADERRGEIPRAAVAVNAANGTPGDELAEDLIAYVAERLARYKHLGSVTFVDAIPRNAGGKVLRRALREADATGGMSDA
jgi:long-chain acyl-CoA synthetase